MATTSGTYLGDRQRGSINGPGEGSALSGRAPHRAAGLVARVLLAGFLSLALLGGLGSMTAEPAAAADDPCQGPFNRPIIWAPDQQAVLGTEGPDIILVASYNRTIFAGGGDDLICYGKYYSGATQVIYGGFGNDRIYFAGADYPRGGFYSVFGEAGNDRLYGSPFADLLNGGEGDDYLYGLDGDDRLDGGSGSDHLYGDSGNDRLSGDAGNDDLWGDDGADRLYGSGDNDRLWGGTGDDELWGGDGADQLYGGNNDDTLVDSGAVGLNQFDCGAGTDKVSLGQESFNCELFLR